MITLIQFPLDYATIQRNVGGVYGILLDVENKKDNCIKALENYKESLKVFIVKNY